MMKITSKNIYVVTSLITLVLVILIYQTSKPSAQSNTGNGNGGNGGGDLPGDGVTPTPGFNARRL